MEEIIEKYSRSIMKNINKENFLKIINFLNYNKCNYIEDIISDYLDLFTIDYDIFKEKYDYLDNKYQNQFLSLASENMNMFEEFFVD